MFLTKEEKELGYELQWKNRDSKILTKHGRVIGTVDSREAIFMAVESHERYLEILKMNNDEKKPISVIDKAHIAAFVIMVFVIAALSIFCSLE